jgi:hypothetical protein
VLPYYNSDYAIATAPAPALEDETPLPGSTGAVVQLQKLRSTDGKPILGTTMSIPN